MPSARKLRGSQSEYLIFPGVVTFYLFTSSVLIVKNKFILETYVSFFIISPNNLSLTTVNF